MVDEIDLEPEHVIVAGRPHWRWPSGKTLPVVSGGTGPTDPPGGDPAPSDPPGGDPEPGDPPGGDPAPGDAWDEVRAREAITKRNRENAALRKRLQDLEAAEEARRQADLTETQKAQEAQRKAEEAARDAERRVAAAEIKAALAGVVPDPGAVVDDLNIDRFVDDTGSVDTEAVEQLRQRYAALVPAGKQAPAPNPGQGANGIAPSNGGTPQLTRDDLKRMSSDQIVKARREGRLDELLGRTK